MYKPPSWVSIRSQALPDYTVFPQVRDWNGISSKTQGSIEERISLYVHLPFCENLCVFCGCNVVVSPWQQTVEMNYLDLLEMELALGSIHQSKVDKIFVGGGSPNFMSPKGLERLRSLLSQAYNLKSSHWHFELDPRKTSKPQLDFFCSLDRVTLQWGVQDFTPRIQKLIHRNLTWDHQEHLMAETSPHVQHGMDFIWGLPSQNIQEFLPQLQDLKRWNLNALKIYRYIDPPWNKKGQRYFKEGEALSADDVFSGLLAIERSLSEQGWWHSGRGIFYPDTLKGQIQTGKVFLSGWCPESTRSLIGHGVGALSSDANGHRVNDKAYPLFEKKLRENRHPTERSHFFEGQESKKQALVRNIFARGFLTDGEVKEWLSDGVVELHQTEGWLKSSTQGLETTSAWLWPWIIATLDPYLQSRKPSFPRVAGLRSGS